MSETVIKVQNLSKRYLVSHQSKQRETSLRDVVMREVRTFGRTARDMLRGRQVVQGEEVEEFWALKDLNFEVKQGEVIGIIGRNGAGKSTLLKILSRITEPTEGRVELRGNAACLLEVGTGFHSELTGRENIFLNGAILGMRRSEIRKKFDEIVSFAEVERFLDTPVKRYSSGMYMRLAFAIAAHLEPEILIVDEVLAVGDADFQKKCLGKMSDVSRLEGRTVLFVSHDMAAVGELTHRAMLLEGGRIAAIGPTRDVISSYISKGRLAPIYIHPSDRKTGAPHISRAEIVTSNMNNLHRFGEPLEVKLWINHETPLKKGCLSISILNQFNQRLVRACAFYPDVRFGDQKGESLLVCRFPSLRLNIGQYHLSTNLTEPPGQGEYESLDNICPFEVVQTEETRPWGWHQGDCVYHEQWQWAKAQ